MKPLLIATAALLATGPAQARGLDLFYVPSADINLSVPGSGEASGDGDGYGVSLEAPMHRGRAFLAEYQKVEYEDSGEGLDQYRLGFGFFGRQGSGLIVQYANLEFFDVEMDGGGAHLRFARGRADDLLLHAEAGYLHLDDGEEKFKGLEYSVGLSFPLDGGLGGFIDYRVSDLEGDRSGVELEFKDLRLGLRLGM